MHASDNRLAVTLKQSRTLAILSSALHGLALWAAMHNTLSITFKVMLGIGILGHLYIAWRRFAKQPPLIIGYIENIGWTLSTAAAPPVRIDVLPSTLLTPYLIVLHYRQLPPDTRFKSVACCPDSCISPTAFRALVVQLKITAGADTRA